MEIIGKCNGREHCPLDNGITFIKLSWQVHVLDVDYSSRCWNFDRSFFERPSFPFNPWEEHQSGIFSEKQLATSWDRIQKS